MIPLHYTIIRLPSNPGGRSLQVPDLVVANLLFTRLHRCAQGAPYALAMPAMRGGSDANLGRLMVVYRDSAEGLAALLRAVPVSRVLRDHCEDVVTLRTVGPNDVRGWERYVRDRRVDRASPSAQRRAQRRFDAGRREGAPPASETTEMAQRQWPYFHHQSLQALRSGRDGDMRVFVRRELCATEPAAFKFNAFGLAQEGGALPVLRSVEAYLDDLACETATSP